MAAGETKEQSAARRETILHAAVEVFLRYGYKKTSMDDLARAAGLSRQGLYLHFATKDALFKEGVFYLANKSRARTQAALARADLPIEDRLVGAFVALKSNSDGSDMSQEHMAELFQTATQLVGPVLADLEIAIMADIAGVLQSSGVAAQWKESGFTAQELAQHLYAASHGNKYYVKSPAEYQERMRIAVRLVCRSPQRSPQRR